MGCLLQLLGGVLVGLSLFAFLFGFWPGLVLILLGLWLGLTGQRVIAARRFEQKMLRYYDELAELARQEVEVQRQLMAQQSAQPKLRLKRVSWWRRLFHRGELIGDERGKSEEWES
ncbi:MAG: hypothetical protein FJ272_11355 [Planctomycetes bacterium]|nr:hypothetical protein [Planctomycetota bacterium]